MLKVHLTQKEKTSLESRHKSSRDKRESDRIKAVLLCAEGWSSSLIAQALRKHETSIVRHLNDFIQTKKLSSESGGSEGYLNDEQTQRLIHHCCEVTYCHAHQRVAYIKQEFAVDYTVPGLNKWLHRHGFSYKKPKSVPHKFEADKQAAFIAYYEALKSSLPPMNPCSSWMPCIPLRPPK